MFSRLKRNFGFRLARYLSKSIKDYKRLDAIDPEAFAHMLKPGDLILVEGDTRFSIFVKYLTQSTWSHVAMYVGDRIPPEKNPSGSKHVLIEADVTDGVKAIPLKDYKGYNLRICRPVGLAEEDVGKLTRFMTERLGHQYDLKNVHDLMRFLLPLPPFLSRNRRKYLEFGSSDPTRAICSSIIALAFQSINYPILPGRGFQCVWDPDKALNEDVLCKRHNSRFTPRDFDLSPYFKIIKPTLRNFNYRELVWQEEQEGLEQ